MTQRDEARQAVAALYKDCRDNGALARLADVLGKAQNGPPYGESDGSIDGPLWSKLRSAHLTFTLLQTQEHELQQLLGRFDDLGR